MFPTSKVIERLADKSVNVWWCALRDPDVMYAKENKLWKPENVKENDV